MRNANHYARTPELEALRPSHRIPHQKDSHGQLMFWIKSHYEAGTHVIDECGHPVQEALHSDVGGQPVFAYANHGRWVASCPCGGAQLVHPDDRQFMCVDCGNHWNDHQWAEVIWPKDYKDIEKILNARDPQWANWAPGEDTDELSRENDILADRGGLR